MSWSSEPAIQSCELVSECPIFIAANEHNMDVQYQVKHSKWVWRFTSANRDLKMQRREGNENVA